MVIYLIIVVTCLASIAAFNNRTLFYKLSLSPYSIANKKEWYRTITHAFIHGSYPHLLINMLVFWSFGGNVYRFFNAISPTPTYIFIALYLGAIIVSALYDTRKHKNNFYYNSIGASAGVTAVVFASILFNPMGMIYFFAIVPIPAILFGVLYLWYESYMSRQGGGNINHRAHIIGAIYGFLFPMAIEPSLLGHFISQLTKIF